MSPFDHWVLTGAIFLPVLGAIVIAFIPKTWEFSIKSVALATTLVTLGLGVYLVADFNYDASRLLQFQVNRPWIDVIHSRYHVGIDGISLRFLSCRCSSRPFASSIAGTTSPSRETPRAFSSSCSSSRSA